jgi:hypothetical protein
MRITSAEVLLFTLDDEIRIMNGVVCDPEGYLRALNAQDAEGTC